MIRARDMKFGSLVVVVLLSLAGTGSTLRGSEADEIATVKALEKKAWVAWQNRDLASIKRLCAPDYISTDGKGTVTLTDIERSISNTQIRDYNLGEMKGVCLSKDVVVLYFPAKVSGTEFGKTIPRYLSVSSVWVRRGGKWLSVFVHEAPVKNL